MTDQLVETMLNELPELVEVPDFGSVRAEARRRKRARRSAFAGAAAAVCIGGVVAATALLPADPVEVATAPVEQPSSTLAPANQTTVAEPDVSTTSVVVSPGSTVDDILSRLAIGLDDVSAADLLASLEAGTVESRFLPRDTDALPQHDGFRSVYEGLLAPGTYDLPSGEPPAVVLETLAAEMERRFDDVLAESSGLPVVGGADGRVVSEYEVLVVASLVEAEAVLDVDRPFVAQVIYNRLEAGVALGLDSTAAYAAGKPARELVSDDLNSASPFNTRNIENVGLPPTPIGAPGVASLEAALAPAGGDWFFYVTADEDGGFAFTSTAEEHAEAVQVCRERNLGC